MGFRPAGGARTLVAINPAAVGGGAEKVLVRLLVAARGAGWRVETVVPDGPFATELNAIGIVSTSIPELKLPSGPRIVALARAVARSVRAGRRIRQVARHADVVICNGVLALPAVRAARIGAPVAWLVHDVIARRDWTLMARVFRRAVTIAIAPSNAAAEPLRRLNIPTQVIRNGTDWPVQPARRPARPQVVGIAAFLAPSKGHEVLLEAFARLTHVDTRLEIVGGVFPKGEGYARSLRARAARPDLAGRVRFLDHVDDVLDRMRDWTVAVLPSLYPESAGLVVLEAMSLGVPVVVTDHGGPPEVVGDAGLVVPPGDPAALAGAIDRLLHDDALRARCARSGPALVAAGLTVADQQGAWLALFNELSAPRRVGVTWVVPDFVPGLGGTTSQTAAMAHALRARGHEVRVLTRRRSAALARHELIAGVPVTRVGIPGNGTVAEKLGVLSVAGAMLRRRNGVAQVLMYPDFVVSAALAGRLRRTSMAWAGLGDASDTLGSAAGALRRVQHWVRRAILARCANTVLTRAMQQELTELGIGAEVIPLPLDLDRFRPPSPQERGAARARLGLERADLAVVYTGQLRRLKSLDQLVDAFRRYVASGRRGRLLLVGGDSGTPDACGAELRHQVAATGMEGLVSFVGRVDDVRPYLHASDVFVLPSTREGMPNSLIEAMACGLACVAPAQPVGEEILGAAGVVTADNKAESLAAALIELADDPAERHSLGVAAAVAARAWERDAVCDRYEALYERLVTGDRR
jgi:glycosyltransferase involved in cell wall biosynthesis